MSFLNSLKILYARSLKRRPEEASDNGAGWFDLAYRNAKITQLEQEFHNLMASSPTNVARLSQIVSELGRQWNAKLRDEQEEPRFNGDEPKDITQLQESVSEIVRDGMKKMGDAGSKSEIRIAFADSLNKMICLFE